MRRLRTLGVLLLMVAFGVGVNRFIASRKSDIAQAGSTPDATKPKFPLPGTVYLAQAGSIYVMRDGNFTKLKLPDKGFWMQPHALPDGTLLAVARGEDFSDLFHLSADGSIIKQLTKNHVATYPIQLNHWIFWPTASLDGATILASVDNPKPGYNVSYQEDLSIWAGPIAGPVTSTRWTTGDAYTGGDVQAQLLPHGGLVYVTYGIDKDSHVVAQVAFQATPKSDTVSLTAPEDDCGAVAVAPDGITLAMVCTADTQTAKLKIAHLRNGKLDTPTVLVGPCLCNSPVWAPDGSGLLYMAPGDAHGTFQLWWLAHAATQPEQPQVVTGGVDLDATSPPTWYMQGISGVAPSASS